MKQYLPLQRQWTQTNDGSGTVRASFNVDFDAERGKVRVSNPVNKIFDADETFAGGSNDFDGYVAKFIKFEHNGQTAYWALADYLFYSLKTDSGLVDQSNWLNDGEGNSPSVNNQRTDAVVFDDLLLVIDNDDVAAYNKSSWTASWWQGTLGGTNTEIFKFLFVGANGNLYLLTENNKVFKVTPDGTRTESGDGTLDRSADEISFTCVNGNSTRMFIGFANEDNDRGGIIEWDMSANSETANKTHRLGAVPKCIAEWNDTIIVILSNGRIKYFNGVNFVDYDGMRLPKIDGVYGDFIHPNGWAIIDDMPHFLIKGTEQLEGRADRFEEDTQAKSDFPSAIYCLDPNVGFYPRFALTNNTSSETHYSLPTVHDVGALFALNTEYTKFLASYEIYTLNEDSVASNKGVVAYYDRLGANPSQGWILFNDTERADASKNVQLLHRVLDSGSYIRVYMQDKEENEQSVAGVWNSTTTFHTTDTLTGLDDQWIAWVKTGNGAGQFLRVDKLESTSGTNIITFKDTNTFVSVNDPAAITFMKFRFMGKQESTTKDYETFTFPADSKTRKVRVLVELFQAGGSVTELDYGIIDT